MDGTATRGPPGRTWLGRIAFTAAAAAFVVTRALPFGRARVGLVLDSYDYIKLAQAKTPLAALAAKRPPTFLLVMKLLSGRWQIVTWSQFAIAVAAWILLAWVAARAARTSVGKVATVTAVLLLGSCLDVAQWDRLIGTESLSISLGVLLVVAAYLLHERVVPARVAIVGVLALLWGMLRDANAIVLAVVGLGLAIWVLARRSKVRAPVLAVAVVFLATFALSLVSADIGARWEDPVKNVVTMRVLRSPERRHYFLAHGLPLSNRQVRRISGHCVNPTGAFLCTKFADPAFYHWIDHNARDVYFHSWLAFPATTLWEPLANARSTIGTRLPLADAAFTGLNDPTGRSIEAKVFPRSPRVLVIWIALDVVALAFTVRRRGWPAAATVPVVVLVLTYPHLWAAWTGDTFDGARHALVASIQLRVGLWLTTLALVDAWLAPDADARGPPSVMEWHEAGDPRGRAVVYFHGTASDVQEIPFPEVAALLGVRLLMADRPGYGRSQPMRDLSLFDIARIVLADLDERGVERSSVLGWSGGGPHALACAAVAPERVDFVGLFGSWAPMHPPDPGLPAGVRLAMRAATVLPRSGLRAMLLLGRHNCVGMVDDVRRVARSWQFDVEAVAASVRVCAWHSERDPQVPVAPWRKVDSIELTVLPGNAHDVSLDTWTTALQAAADSGSD